MQTPDKDRLDLWLDQALRQQGDVEPRAGLESRLLSRMRSREKRSRAIRRWVLILGSPVVAVVLIALVWRGERTDVHAPNLNTSNGIAHHTPVEQASGKMSVPSAPGDRPVKIAGTRRHQISTQAPLTEPRLAHFPSVRAPSTEELVLARYAENYPQEAMLAAKEQQEFEVAVQKAQQETEEQARISNE